MNRWLTWIFPLLTCALWAQEPAPAVAGPAAPPPTPAATQPGTTPPANPAAENGSQTPATSPPQTPVDPNAPPPVRVVVLGYHEFSSSEPETEMRINTAKFRKQMEFIRDSGYTVVSLADFSAWKRGEKSIPDKSVLITLDDGWKSVYDEAYPILREFKFPFTLFLYTNYINGGGKALSTAMIREMVKNGATIASHSVSHPYPVVFRRYRNKGAEQYATFLRKEMGESKKLLESKFPGKIHGYSYPGGYVTEEMWPILTELGYQIAFTIQPAKTTIETPALAIPRFMILGTHDRVFELAMSFDPTGPQDPAALVVQATDPAQRSPHPVL
ncbi:MAG TPA: polysaccharide deacetylase family protein, partial [Luteolibacter sp.]|nr:polysaccharide deacetylase family protein [Luteolibacter sp.]